MNNDPKKNTPENTLVVGVGGDLVHERGGGAPVLVGERLGHALLHLGARDDLVLAVFFFGMYMYACV